MKAKLRLIVGMACGMVVGSVVYQAVRHGMSDVDWEGIAFTTTFSFLFLLCVPAKWLGLEARATKEGV